MRFATVLFNLCILFCSCEQEVTHLLPQGLKDYCRFKEGTWWIYADSTGANLDTIKVANFSEGTTITESNNQTDNREFFMYWTAHHIDSLYAPMSLFKADAKAMGTNGIFKFDQIETGNEFPTTIIDFLFPVVPGLTIGNCTTTNFFDVYEGFPSVVEMTNTYHPYFVLLPNNPTKMYYARHVGMIRLQSISSGTVYKLVDYNIVQ